MPHPLAEVFGFPTDNLTGLAENHRVSKTCPFTNIVCTKDKAASPLGVCSILEGSSVAITCPQRFKENNLIYKDAADFFFPPGTEFHVLPEVRMKNGEGESAGNVDAVLAVFDKDGKVLDFGSLEIQAVYVSGNIRNPFEHYMNDRGGRKNMNWTGPNYPHADYLSSSRKRLAPQILTKGGIFNAWGKKQAIALHAEFFDTLPSLPTVTKDEADVAWMVYDIELDGTANVRKLRRNRIVYTTFEAALRRITASKPGSIADFEAVCQTKAEKLGLFE